MAVLRGTVFRFACCWPSIQCEVIVCFPSGCDTTGPNVCTHVCHAQINAAIYMWNVPVWTVRLDNGGVLYSKTNFCLSIDPAEQEWSSPCPVHVMQYYSLFI